MSEWQTIDTAPKDGSEILAYSNPGGQDVVCIAFWSDGINWELQGFDNQDEVRGWWTYRNSVAQEKLEGMYEPTLWSDYIGP